MRIVSYFIFTALTITLYAQTDLLEKAVKLEQKGDFQGAYDTNKEAAEIQYANGDLIGYADTHLKMVDNQLQHGDLFLAKSLAENTLLFVQSKLNDELTIVARTKTLLGLSYLNLGRNDEALEQLTDAERLFTEESKEQADCFDALGLVYTDNENNQLAAQYHEQALKIRRNLFGVQSIPVANSYNNLGRVYAKNEPLQAIIYFNRAQDIYEKELGGDSRRALRTQLNIAYANMEQKNYDEALKLLNEVKRTYENRFGKENSNVAFIQSTIGRVQLLQENYENALINQNAVLQQYIRLYGEKHPEVANTYYLIGEIYKARSDFKLSVEFYQRAIYANLPGQTPSDQYELPTLSNYLNADVLLTSLQAKAIALEALHYEKTLNLKDLTGAIDTYVKCDELITQVRRKRLNEQDKLRLGQIAKEVYESGIQLSLNLSEQSFNRRKYLERAFEFCERSKSAVLLEAITESNAKEFAGIPKELLTLEDSLKDEISYLEQQLASADNDGEQHLEDRLFSYQNSYREFISKLEAEFPDYFNLKYSQQIASVSDIQRKLSDESVMLSYFIGKNEIYTFIISKGGIQADRKPKNEDFEKQPKALRNAIKYNIPDAFITSSKSLYKQLMPKLTGSIAELIILPDGVLGTIPFEALIDPDSESQDLSEMQFLIKKYTISYDYSATLFIEKETSDFPQNPEILLLAPIHFDRNEMKMATLPGTEKEINEIELLFKGNNGTPNVQMGIHASEFNFKKERLHTYQFVHFATHGFVNESQPELSRIFLSPGDQEDGSLYTGEIYNLNINADLVTLSACETGLGKVAKGEGIVGLSRALQYAGAKNIIVSLWQVADESTAEMMIKFYTYNLHNTHHGYNSALRQAKLSLLNSEEYARPYYWAPFILVGM